MAERRPLAPRGFPELWGAQTLSQFGSQISGRPAAGVDTRARCTRVRGCSGPSSSAVPALHAAAGVWVDRLPRTPILIAHDLIRVVLLASIVVRSLTIYGCKGGLLAGGRLLQVPDAVLRIGAPVRRCVVTTRDPETGELDLDTLALIRRYRGPGQRRHVQLGVYARVERLAHVRTGDVIELLLRTGVPFT
jgi:hypothetical protein